jgi:hypothetical protein
VELQEDEIQELKRWFCDDGTGVVDFSAVALALDRLSEPAGLWQSLLRYVSWPELCTSLIPLVSGTSDRHLRMTAADVAAEKFQLDRCVTFPEWTRGALTKDRRMMHLLRTLGAEVLADASEEGLLVLFGSQLIADVLAENMPALSLLINDFLGASLEVRRPSYTSPAHCIASVPSFQIDTARARHVALQQLIRRKEHAVRDCTCRVLGVREQYVALLGAGRTPAVTRTENAEDFCQAIWADDEVLEMQSAKIEADLMRNENRHVDDPAVAEHGTAHDPSHEAALLRQMDVCTRKQDAERVEMLELHHHLEKLEAKFAEARQKLLLKYELLSDQVAVRESELAAVSAGIAEKKEAVRSAVDVSRELRMELAEKMLPLPLDLSPGLTAEIEVELSKEVQLLRFRKEKLEKAVRKAKSQCKKRLSPPCP